MNKILLAYSILLCILWCVFCLRVQHIISGKIRTKDVLVILLNFLFAPISLILDFKRIPDDFKRIPDDLTKKKEDLNG